MSIYPPCWKTACLLFLVLCHRFSREVTSLFHHLFRSRNFYHFCLFLFFKFFPSTVYFNLFRHHWSEVFWLCFLIWLFVLFFFALDFDLLLLLLSSLPLSIVKFTCPLVFSFIINFIPLSNFSSSFFIEITCCPCPAVPLFNTRKKDRKQDQSQN